MELVTYTVPFKKGINRPVVVAPLGDIQYAGPRSATATTLLKDHIKRCQDKDAYYLGLGDYIDFASPSNRQRLRAAALYDSAEDVIDDKARELVYDLYETILKPTTGRWIGLVHGHHWAHLKTGETTDTLLCELLKARFLGTAAYVRLVFHYQTAKMQRAERYNVVLFVHHGCGGGMKAAAPLNKLENVLPYLDADVLFMGHTTKQGAVPIERLTPKWNAEEPFLDHRTVYLVSTGGFSRGYMQGAKQGRVAMGSYVEQKMLNPAALGAPIVTITPHIQHEREPIPGAGGERGQTRHWAPQIRVEL